MNLQKMTNLAGRSCPMALLFSLLLLTACRPQDKPTDTKPAVLIEGKTMGSYYRILYLDDQQRNFQPQIEELLKEINAEVNTYDSTSFISSFNNDPTGMALAGPTDAPMRHFMANFETARRGFEASEGYYDCTIMPLVNYWGFGYADKQAVAQADSARIDALRQLVDMNLLTIETQGRAPFLRKQKPGVQLDFSSCAQGYATDQIALLLEEQGIGNYLVDISGEQRAKGVNAKGKTWQIGINTPKEDASLTDIQRIVKLDNRCLATSGNYRNYYEVDGQKYGHTINPHTGYPERTNLLSATILAPEAITADAFATACMALGLERALAMIKKQPGLDAYFIYADKDGSLKSVYTDGIKAILVEEEAQ
jgi:thiamine biosynthesis lipoprotein